MTEFKIEIHPDIKEEPFRQQIRAIARQYGWEFQYHTYDSRRSESGWPDDVFLHPRYMLALFIEFKRNNGKATPRQKKWLSALAQCGLETAVWRPRDIDKIVDVLGPRQARAVYIPE